MIVVPRYVYVKRKIHVLSFTTCTMASGMAVNGDFISFKLKVITPC